jgi:hypothetical protein
LILFFWFQLLQLPFGWLGGNGGLSLRRISTMRSLFSHLDCQRWQCQSQGMLVTFYFQLSLQQIELVNLFAC